MNTWQKAEYLTRKMEWMHRASALLDILNNHNGLNSLKHGQTVCSD